MDYGDILNSIIKQAETSLDNFVSEITIKKPEIEQASDSYDYIKQVLQSKSQSNQLPKITSNIFLTGSYARKTKISPLDDIDIFVQLNGSDTILQDDGYLRCSSLSAPLAPYSDSNGIISSIVILNKFKSTLGDTYPSEIIRDQQAVSIYLSSYKLKIDIVPALAITNANYYVIANGHGKSSWMKSNPKKDEEIIGQLDNYHNNKIKPAIKIVKYWNREFLRNKLRNYHIESMFYYIFGLSSTPVTSVLNACQIYFNKIGGYLDNCPDPTGMSGPVSDYLKGMEYWERFNLYTEIQNIESAANKSSYELIKYLRKE